MRAPPLFPRPRNDMSGLKRHTGSDKSADHRHTLRRSTTAKGLLVEHRLIGPIEQTARPEMKQAFTGLTFERDDLAAQRAVVAQEILFVVAGLVCGLLVTVAIIRPLWAFLFEVAPTDPATVVAVCGLLAGAALIACYIPARRASSCRPPAGLNVPQSEVPTSSMRRIGGHQAPPLFQASCSRSHRRHR